MNQEKIPSLFPGQKKAEKETHEVDTEVDNYYERPRTNKLRSADKVAHEIIKGSRDLPISLSKLSEEERQWYRNILDCGIRFTNDGFLEVSRWNDNDKSEKGKRLWQKTDGLNAAIRMQEHILDKYRVDKDSQISEFSNLESIQEVIESANEFMQLWKTAKPEEKEELQFKLASVVLQLEKCRNEFKVNIKDQSEAVMKMKDSLNRDNPNALAARTVAALNNLAKRMNEMQLIMPMIAMRKETLIIEKKRIESTLRKSVAQIAGITNHAVFKDTLQKPPETRIKGHEIPILDTKIGKVLYLLGMIHALPYSQQAEQARFVLQNKTKPFFRSKESFLENISQIKTNLSEAKGILEANIEHLG